MSLHKPKKNKLNDWSDVEKALSFSHSPGDDLIEEMTDIGHWKEIMTGIKWELNEDQEEDINMNYPKLVNTCFPACILDYLRQDSKIPDEQCSEIEAKTTDKAKMREIIRICRSHKRRYFSLVRAYWVCEGINAEPQQLGASVVTPHQSVNMQPKSNERTLTKEEIIKNAKKFLGLANLEKHLSIHDVIRAGINKNATQNKGHLILSSLLQMDYRGRERGAQGDTHLEHNTIDSFLGETKKNSVLHPLDAFVIIFNHCDIFLRQVLLQKMFMCKLALPVLFPKLDDDELGVPLFELGSIMLEYSDQTQGLIQVAADQLQAHTVTFMQLGYPEFSKSKLMNAILSKTARIHHTFYDQDCQGGITRKALADGLVECSWYLPCSDSPTFGETVCFMNLRGDARKSLKQLTFLIRISNLVVVLVPIDMLDNGSILQQLEHLHRCKQNCVLFLCGKKTDHTAKALEAYKKRIGLEGAGATKLVNDYVAGEVPKNIPTLKLELSKIILQTIDCKAQKKSLLERFQEEEKAFSQGTYFTNTHFQSGKRYAEAVLFRINAFLSGGALTKSDLLPLQQASWRTYSDLLRKRGKLRHDTDEPETLAGKTDKFQQEMQCCRERQRELCTSVCEPIEQFINIISSEGTDVNLFFLNCLKKLLDEKMLPQQKFWRKEYVKRWQIFQQRKCCTGALEDARSSNLINDIDIAEKRLDDVIFGVEHMFREMAQMFESSAGNTPHTTTDQRIPRTHKCPKSMANLILKGYPFEIMDAEASNIPMTWLTSVFDSLRVLMGKRRFLVLTVLGLQSSGKSTLLNTMFGLQFAVSAGRCTRGVYGQLVPVGYKDVLPFDYVLVIDTEGLRGIDYGNKIYSHDNELATLAVGLGDIVLVNVKGENTTEITDVLQIVVHAFCRMFAVGKHLALNHSCVFVHQNVATVDAKEKLLAEQHLLQNRLDKLTVEAAEEEQIHDIYRFQDVIGFDCEENVFYISDLWEGEAPMAPVNPSYAEKVSKVRDSIINSFHMRPGQRFSSFEDFMIRVKDLWEAIVADDFVYSFRNSLEIKAYTGLETQMLELDWDFVCFTMEWVQNEVQIKIPKCVTIEDLQKCSKSLEQDIDKKAAEQLSDLLKRLDKYFETSFLKEILSLWKARKNLELEKRTNENKKMALQQLDQATRRQEELIRNEKQLGELENVIRQTATTHAVKLKNQVSEHQVNKEFDKMWEKCVGKHKIGKPYMPNIKAEAENILIRLYGEVKQNILSQELKQPKREGLTGLQGSIQLYELDSSHFELHEGAGIDYKENWKERLMFWKDSLSKARDNKKRYLITRLHPKVLKKILEIKGNALSMWEQVFNMLKQCLNDEDVLFTVSLPYRRDITGHVLKWAFSSITQQLQLKNDEVYASLLEALRTYPEKAIYEVMNIVSSPQDRFAGTYDYKYVEQGIEALSKEDMCSMEHLKITMCQVDDIFREVEAYVIDKTRVPKPFNSAYISEAVEIMKNHVKKSNERESQKPSVKILPSLEIKMAVQVSRYAAIQFEEMQRKYDELHGPAGMIEKQKIKYFHLFKNTLQNAVNEVTAADLFCDTLQGLILQTTTNNLSLPIREELFRSFPKKYLLIKYIQQDLAENNEFSDFMKYVSDAEDYARTWLSRKVQKMFFSVNGSGQTHYATLACEELRKIVDCVEQAIKEANKVYTPIEEGNSDKKIVVKLWIDAFCSKVSTKLAVSVGHLRYLKDHPMTDYDVFQRCVCERLRKIKEQLKIHFQNIRAYDCQTDTAFHRQVMDRVWGCPAQCPLCHEPCQYNEVNHLESGVKHRCIQHRPKGVDGVSRVRSKKLSVESCNYSLHIDKKVKCGKWSAACMKENDGKPCLDNEGEHVFHRYRDHHKYIPDWEIAPSPDITHNKYWAWFMKTYKEDLVKYYGDVLLPDIPKSWNPIDKEAAIDSLKEY